MQLNLIWRINAVCDFYQWHNNNEECVFFNVLSGQTHILNPLAVGILDILNGQALNEEDIWKQLVELYEDINSDDADMQGYILGVLTNLDEIGLIEPYAA